MRRLSVCATVLVGAVVGAGCGWCAALLGAPDWEAAVLGLAMWPIMTVGFHVVEHATRMPANEPEVADLDLLPVDPPARYALSPNWRDVDKPAVAEVFPHLNDTVVLDRDRLGLLDRQQPGQHRIGRAR